MRKRTSHDSKAVHARKLMSNHEYAVIEVHGHYAEDAWQDYRRPAFYGTNLEAGKLGKK